MHHCPFPRTVIHFSNKVYSHLKPYIHSGYKTTMLNKHSPDSVYGMEGGKEYLLCARKSAPFFTYALS